MSSPRRRIETDVMRLLMSDYEVTLVNDNMYAAAPDSADPTGRSSMSSSAAPKKQERVCVPGRHQPDMVSDVWWVGLSGAVLTADMINIFEVFLPQLLRYPNPADPLNGEAAALLMREPKTYEMRVRDYVTRYATADAAAAAADSSDDAISSLGSLGSDDAAGPLEV
ncbi:hypothetical protein PMAC_003250 [Pneumocystis sp. 'macacae']|nr:hypothetical protein PMAC_003250 [Pneumocystis sp. 'macacae']